MPRCPCHSIWPQSQLDTAGSREHCVWAVEAAVQAGNLHEAEVPDTAGPFPPGIVLAYACTACQQTWLLELPDRASGNWYPEQRGRHRTPLSS